MLKQIIGKEILGHLMSLRFAIACVLCFVVVIGSLFVRSQEYRIAAGDYHEDKVGQQSFRDKMRHPWDMVWGGVKEERKPNPLKIFVRGIDEGARLSAQFNSHKPIRLVGQGERNPLMLLFPAMDLVTFVGIIMSLLAIVFGYDAICGEKERGTLRLMLSYSVPRDRVLLGKWIGGYVMLVTPFILAAISGAAILLVQRDIAFTSAQWLKLASVCLLALLYMATVYGLSVWVSCLTRRSATSVMILVTIWMVLVLVIPNLSPYVARAARPALGPLELQQTRQAAARDIWDREVRDKMRLYDEEHGLGEQWWRKINWDVWEGGREIGERRWLYELGLEKEGHLQRLNMYHRLEEELQKELDDQVRLTRWIGRLSPFSCFAMATAEITDTGVLVKRRFLSQLRPYQARLCEYAHEECRVMVKAFIESKGKDRVQWGQKANRVAPIPVFTYTPPATSDYLRESVLDAGVLLAAALLFFMLSYVQFLRYDVR